MLTKVVQVPEVILAAVKSADSSQAHRLLLDGMQEQLGLLAGNTLSTRKFMVKDLIATGYKGNIVEIGAGVGISETLFFYPGVSALIESTYTPYFQPARDVFLGMDASKIPSVSQEMSELLAANAMKKSTLNNMQRYGLAVTAATATARKRRGQDHFYMSLLGEGFNGVTLHGVYLHPERIIQQKATAQLGLRLMHQTLAQKTLDIPGLMSSMDELLRIDQVFVQNDSTFDHVKRNIELINYKYSDLVFFQSEATGQTSVQNFVNSLRNIKELIAYKGSFCPTTKGHAGVLEASINKRCSVGGITAQEMLPFLEISLEVIDKAEVPVDNLAHRVIMAGLMGLSVMITRNSRYVDFAENLGRYTDLPLNFAMGIDTYDRIIDPQYYSDIDGGVEAVMARILRNCNRMLVGDRDGRTVKGTDNIIPLEVNIPCSSSMVRAAVKKGTLQTVQQHVDTRVTNYIKKNNLFLD